MENLILLIMMLSVCLKANMFSIIYVLFICKFMLSPGKTVLLVHAAIIISLCVMTQYFLFLLNMTNNISPAMFPKQLTGYPLKQNFTDNDYLDLKYSIPIFFHDPRFHDLKLCYFLGIGIDDTQINNLVLDFIDLFLISMYIFNFRNPVLVKSVHKIFWQFPTMSDSI